MKKIHKSNPNKRIITHNNIKAALKSPNNPKTTRSGKASKSEMISRINLVLKLLLLGYKHNKILWYFKEKNDPPLELSNMTITTYIRRATAEIEKKADFYKKRELGKALARLETLYEKSYIINDFKNCLAVQKEINDLLGLAEPQKMEIRKDVFTHEFAEKTADFFDKHGNKGIDEFFAKIDPDRKSRSH